MSETLIVREPVRIGQHILEEGDEILIKSKRDDRRETFTESRRPRTRRLEEGQELIVSKKIRVGNRLIEEKDIVRKLKGKGKLQKTNKPFMYTVIEEFVLPDPDSDGSLMFERGDTIKITEGKKTRSKSLVQERREQKEIDHLRSRLQSGLSGKRL